MDIELKLESIAKRNAVISAVTCQQVNPSIVSSCQTEPSHCGLHKSRITSVIYSLRVHLSHVESM